jgi:hypothetical protein
MSPPSSWSDNEPSKRPAWRQVTYSSTLNMVPICSSETSVDIHRTTRRYIPDGSSSSYCSGLTCIWLTYREPEWRGPRGRSSSAGGVKNFLFSASSRQALRDTQTPIQWVSGALSPGVKRPRREADHSLATSAEVKKMWIYTSTLSLVFMA